MANQQENTTNKCWHEHNAERVPGDMVQGFEPEDGPTLGPVDLPEMTDTPRSSVINPRSSVNHLNRHTAPLATTQV